MTKNRKQADVQVGLVVVGATLGFFGLLEFLRPGYFLWDDNASFYLPAYVHAWRSLVEGGALAHINVHQYLGQIWLGNGQSGVLYPPVYLAAGFTQWLWGDLRHTIDVLAIGHLALASLGMFVLLRSWRVRRTIASSMALAWVTFPFLAQVSRNWVVVAFVAALLPWNLLLVERLRQRPTVARALVLAALKALLFYQGYVQYAVLAALADGLYLVLRQLGDESQSRRGGVWLRLAVAYGFALLATGALAAPLLAPMWQVRQLSAYRAGALSFAEFVSNALPLDAFVSAQIGVMTSKAVHQTSGAMFYVGLPVLVLLVGCFFMRGRLRLHPAALPVAITALMALVLATRAWGLLYRVPLLSSFRWPFKSYLLFLLFATVAAALMLEALVVRGRGRWATGLIGVTLIANAAVLLAPSLDRPFGPYRVARDLGELTKDVVDPLPAAAGGGRVISLWQRHNQADMPHHLTLAFATLTGAHHLGGYDPLIARENLDLALGLDYSNIFRYAVNDSILPHLARWSVRTLIAPANDPRYRAALDAVPALRKHHEDASRVVYEHIDALPVVSFHDAPKEPVAFDWHVNGIDVHPKGKAGTLRVALAPLPWWFWSIDGVDQGAVPFDDAKQMALVVLSGSQVVSVRYDNVPFRLGMMTAASFLVAVLGGLAWRRRRDIQSA